MKRFAHIYAWLSSDSGGRIAHILFWNAIVNYIAEMFVLMKLAAFYFWLSSYWMSAYKNYISSK